MRFAYMFREPPPTPVLYEDAENVYLASDFGNTAVGRSAVRLVDELQGSHREFLRSHYTMLQERAWQKGNMSIQTKVRILRTEDFDLGWENRWTEFMDDTAGMVGKVEDINGIGGVLVSIPGFGRYWYPYYALQKEKTTPRRVSPAGPMQISVVDYSRFALVFITGGTTSVARAFTRKDSRGRKNYASVNDYTHTVGVKDATWAKKLARYFVKKYEITVRKSHLKAIFTKQGILVKGKTGESGWQWLRNHLHSDVHVVHEKVLLRNENGETEKSELEIEATLTAEDILNEEGLIEQQIRRILAEGGRQ